jgi:hypothetical protein
MIIIIINRSTPQKTKLTPKNPQSVRIQFISLYSAVNFDSRQNKKTFTPHVGIKSKKHENYPFYNRPFYYCKYHKSH